MNAKNNIRNITPLRGNDAILQDFNIYFRTFYTHIQRFGFYSYSSDADNMFKALSSLFDLVSCRFDKKQFDDIEKKLDKLQKEVFSIPKRSVTTQTQSINNKNRIEAIEKMRKIMRQIMNLLNEQNMLVPTYTQDYRPVAVR